MKKFTIISDSSCDLMPKDFISDKFDFFTAPISITVGEKTFADDETLSLEQLREAIKIEQAAVKTACPSPEAFAQLMRSEGDIICITLSSKLSGSFNSASLAAQMVQSEMPDKRIFVLDSLTTSAALALILLKTFELVENNCSYEHICETLKVLSWKTQIRFLLQDYSTLVKSGRVSKLAGLIASVLIIKTVCGNNEGEIKMFNKVIGTKKGLRLMCAQAAAANSGKIVITHHDNPDDAQIMCDILSSEHQITDVIVLPMRGTASSYACQNGISIAF